MMEAKKIYSKYDKQVQDYMQNVIDCLKQDYKNIPSSWRISLDLIADNYAIYLKAKNDVMENGLLRKDTHNRTFKNQSFSLMMATQNVIMRLLSSFGLSPMSKSKMKNMDTEDFGIEDLLNE